MLNPSIGKLIKACDSRYKLVHDVANRARQISQKAEEEHEILVVKPISLAIDELCAEMEAKED